MPNKVQLFQLQDQVRYSVVAVVVAAAVAAAVVAAAVVAAAVVAVASDYQDLLLYFQQALIRIRRQQERQTCLRGEPVCG